MKTLLLSTLLLSGCATTYRGAQTGPSAFAFTLSPEQCEQLKRERRTYRATEKTALYVGGAGAVITGVALAFTDKRTAPALSTGAVLLAGGVGMFSGSQVSDLDEELAAAGCSR